MPASFANHFLHHECGTHLEVLPSLIPLYKCAVLVVKRRAGPAVCDGKQALVCKEPVLGLTNLTEFEEVMFLHVLPVVNSQGRHKAMNAKRPCKNRTLVGSSVQMVSFF